jgi:hypothetical protein
MQNDVELLRGFVSTGVESALAEGVCHGWDRARPNIDRLQRPNEGPRSAVSRRDESSSERVYGAAVSVGFDPHQP